MSGRWNTQSKGKKKKKGHLNMHAAVNVATKEILALEVADGKAHDGKEMNVLVGHVLNRDNTTYKSKRFLQTGVRKQQEFRLSSKQEYSARNQGKKEIHKPHHQKQRDKISGTGSKRDFLNGKRKEDMESDGWLKRYFHP